MAVHKYFFLRMHLKTDENFENERLSHINRVRLLKLKLSQLILSRRGSEISDSNQFSSVQATEFLLMIQRMDSKFYEYSFLKLMSRMIKQLKQSIYSLGFNDFFGYLIILLRINVKYEKKRAGYIMRRNMMMNNPFLKNQSYEKRYSDSLAWHNCTVGLERMCDELYDSNIKLLWNTESLYKVANVAHQTSGSKKTVSVTALTVDAKNDFYAAFSDSKVKVWQFVQVSSKLKSVSKDSKFRLLQDIELMAGDCVNSLLISGDSKKLFIACSNSILLYSLSSKGNLSTASSSGQKFSEVMRFLFHKGVVNCLCFSDR